MSTHNLENDGEVKLLESPISFHEFTDCVEQLDYTCHITRMKDSLYVWIGKTGDEMMNELAYAFLSAYDNLPVATRILRKSDEDRSSDIAMQLTSLTKKPVYLSCNIALDHARSLAIRKRLIDEFKTHPEIMRRAVKKSSS